MLTVHTPTIRKAGSADRAGVGAALSAAFFTDPVFGFCFPDEDRRRVALPAFFELAAGIFARHDDTWCVGDDVLGAAIWSPAGVAPMTDEEGERFGAHCAELAGPDAGRVFDIVALLDENHPHEPDHDYLWLLGVTPQRQGAGYGSALLRTVLDREPKVPAYLEATSPDNRRLYERHGFEVVTELTIPNGPPLWAMWREPAR